MLKNYLQLIHHPGNTALFKSLQMSIISIKHNNPLHIHAQGLRGTGKTTIIRATRELLPKILRIKECPYNCHPKKPLCPEHKGLSEGEIKEIGIELIDMPFLEISHSAKIGTVVGTIDLEKISDKNNPTASLLPGSLPRANRGIVFIDEINRLADTSPELVDVLLDVMGTKPGRIQIEETGLKTVEIPINVCIWAASNPDEEPGPLEDIRKQLSDRFDLVIDVERPKDPRIVKDIISIGFKNGKRQSYVKREYPFYKEIKEMCNIYREIAIPDEILKILASIYVDFNIESIRGIESLLTGAKLYSALNKRKTVTFEDIHFSAPLALRHRVDINTLTNVMKFLDKLLKETNMFDKTNENQTEHSNKFLNLDSNQKQKRNKEKKNKEEKRSSPTYPNKSRLISFLQTIKKACELLLKAVTDKRRSKTSINKNKTSNTTGSSSIADPSKIDIESPYKKAMPIKSIDVSNIVKTEEDLNELSRTIRLSRKLN